ncbi:hypothetical protein CK203_055078 [Vitis vinifera]|uniref:Uncharacterized protein n=1 Tax=Vitis vinifera TaxID=29760 RepID=A0A438GUH0_VITVI|nr:hypothetical protein CK203_055078 [Vitis vinifera]
MHPPMMLLAMVLVGALSSYEWLSETMVMGCGPWLLVVIAYFAFGFVIRNGSKKTVSSVRVSEAGEKAIDKLNAKEFRERFRIPHDVLIDLVNEEAAIPTEKGGKNAILFTKEQFNAGLRFPLPAFVQGIPPLLSDSTHLHSSQPCPGADGMQHYQHAVQPRPYATGIVLCLFPEESKNDIFSVSAHLPSLQMVTELPRFDKGRGEGGWWQSGVDGQGYRSIQFSPFVADNAGLELRGHLVDWVEKASFACVCKLFEIDPKERAYKTLLSARNLTEVVREPQEYVINILPRKLAKDEIVPGEHYTVKELPLYQEAKEADAERRRKLLEDRDQKKTEGTIRKAPGQKRGPDSPPKKTSGKRGKLVKKHGKDMKEPTPPKEFPPPQTTYEGEVMIEEPVNAAPHSISSGPDACRAETAPLEEAGAESQSQPSDDPDRLAIVLVKGPPLKKLRLTRDLQSGLFERLQERQQEIEISCASAHDAHPDGSEVEMATETSAAPAIIPAEDASGPMCLDQNMGAPIPGQELPSASSPEEESADDAALASPFSYAELEVKLKQITPDWKAIKPSAQMFDMIETLVRGPPQHVSTTRSFYSAAADCRLYEDLLLSAPRD